MQASSFYSPLMNKTDKATHTASAQPIMLRATDHRESFAQNTHRVILRNETDTDFFAWPDPTWPGNSDQWKPGIDKPLQYPKFAWEKFYLPHNGYGNSTNLFD